MKKVIDRAGRRFSRLVVISFAGQDKHRNALWVCRCDCGVEKIVAAHCLVSGKTKSCGCLLIENPPPKMITHGMSRSPEHNSWRGMIERCYYEKSTYFEAYGGRGIRVCDEWRAAFINFLSDMGRKPSPRHSIDRINPNGDYCKENCRWALPSWQTFNQSNRQEKIKGVYFEKSEKWSARITFEGKTKFLGNFLTLLDAASARKSAENQIFNQLGYSND